MVKKCVGGRYSAPDLSGHLTALSQTLILAGLRGGEWEGQRKRGKEKGTGEREGRNGKRKEGSGKRREGGKEEEGEDEREMRGMSRTSTPICQC